MTPWNSEYFFLKNLSGHFLSRLNSIQGSDRNDSNGLHDVASWR